MKNTPIPAVPFVAALLLAFALAGGEAGEARGEVTLEDAPLAAQIATSSARLEAAKADLAALQRDKNELDDQLRWISRRAEIKVLGSEFAHALTEQRQALRSSEPLLAALAARESLLARISDDNVRVERALRAATLRKPLSPTNAVDVDVMREASHQQLARLAETQRLLLDTLRSAQQATRELLTQREQARTELTQLLLWIPNPPELQDVSRFLRALTWMVSPANWRAAADTLRQAWERQPWWPTLLLGVSLLLLAFRRPLVRQLAARMPGAGASESYRLAPVAAAGALTLALAAPVPALLWTAGTLLAAQPEAAPFALALADACTRVSHLLLALALFAWLFDRCGIAVGYFGRDPASLDFLVGRLRRCMRLIVPLLAVVALSGLEYAPFAIRQSLGRLSFFLAMLALAAFLGDICRRSKPPMQHVIARSPRHWIVQFHAAWFSALVALPLAVSLLALGGYFVAAAYIFGRMIQSLSMLLAVVTLHGLLLLWVRARYARLAHLNSSRPTADARVRSAAPGIPDSIAQPGEEVHALLNFITTLLLLGGGWWVWGETIPFFSVIADYALWSYSSTVDGKLVSHTLAVGGLFMAILIGVITAVLVRNIGGALDIVLLQRLDMQSDATYAMKVVVRYVLVVAGITLASSTLGIGWSDVQWLVAALSVGLGFGLQEIFGNLVAGLIMLAERPIRIGDIVTVGDVTGIVARIRGRATTLVDFDNKEILIPNKAFITDRVTNWTLSNQTTRLLVKISIPRGKDIAAAQQAMLGAVRGVTDVISELPPAVRFLGGASSTLDFEISAFVDSFGKRQEVMHQINCAVELALREQGFDV